MRTGPLSYAVVVAAVLVAAPALADNAGFVSTNGAHFELNGLPYYYAGANFWQGMNLGMADASGGDRDRLGSELDRLQAAGVTNVRIMAGSEGPNTAPYRMVPALQTAPGSYDPNVFAGLDYLMAELNSRNMRAVMCLNNFWHWSGGMAQYVSWAEGGSAIPYPPSYPDWTGNWETFQTYSAKFYTNATAQDAFKDHINTLLNRTNTVTGVQYKNDPTVFSWELANEPRRYGTTTWVDDTAAYIKSLDANHMVTVGSEGATPWGTKADFVTTHDGAAIDYATCHIWPQNWGWYDPANPTSGSKKYANAESKALDYLQDHLGWSATDLVKPLVLEEFGLARDGGSFDPSAATTYRDQFYAALFAAVLADALADGAAAGDNFWAWGGEGRPSHPAPQWIGDPPHETPGWYSVYDLDAATLAIILDHATDMQSLIPEPATLGLLGVGAGLLLRRRRRHGRSTRQAFGRRADMRTIRPARLAIFAAAVLGLAATAATADPGVYEPGVDPGLGFNLISWWNFGATGEDVWEAAVQDCYDQGFRCVSLCPVRYFNTTTGAIATTSTQGPELSHIAAGIVRAKTLGMTVTVNPFVEPENFAFWRGTWNPSGAVATTFWTDYQQYISDAATMAQTSGADRMTIGTELRAIVNNSAHNAALTSVINAADAAFSGALGYAANWDNYKSNNLKTTVWENAKIDFIGIDAYFQLATNPQADASGAFPNAAFIAIVEDNWNSELDDDILPFAAARKGGAGMPVIFTEHGLIPYNRTTVTPYSSAPGGSQPTDPDEQTNGYNGLLNALDGRAADDDLLEVYLWQWGMPGADGSYWYLNPNGVDNPETTYDESLGNPAAQYLSGYVPEPATLALVALGAAVALGRRR